MPLKSRWFVQRVGSQILCRPPFCRRYSQKSDCLRRRASLLLPDLCSSSRMQPLEFQWLTWRAKKAARSDRSPPDPRTEAGHLRGAAGASREGPRRTSRCARRSSDLHPHFRARFLGSGPAWPHQLLRRRTSQTQRPAQHLEWARSSACR